MSKFFINRPIVAMVISIVLVLVGTLTILSLPVAQFPRIAPPEIQILATYVGADAQTLEQAVATPIEQQMNGVDNMNYMYSLNATGNTSSSLIVDFDVKTDPNTDFILAQARETQAASQLPTDVTNYGVTVRKSVTAPLMWVALYSPHGTYDATFLANYAYINLVDPILRSPGIGNVQVFGAGQYAMRMWVKPGRQGRWRTRAQGPGIYLPGSGAGPTRLTRRVWTNRGTGNARRRNGSRSRRRSGRTGSTGLQHQGPLSRSAH